MFDLLNDAVAYAYYSCIGIKHLARKTIR